MLSGLEKREQVELKEAEVEIWATRIDHEDKLVDVLLYLQVLEK